MVTINITSEINSRLEQDRLHFQKIIGGKNWTISDTINEYLKIISSIEKL